MKYFLVIVLLVSSLLSFSQDCSNPTQMAFVGGEKVTYKVGYYLSPLWISAGEVFFETRDTTLEGDSLYYFNAKGWTFKAYDLLFKVRDQYQSYVRKEDFRPVHFIRDVYEGGFEFFNDVHFNNDSLKAVINDTMSCEITECSFDVLSAVYYSRNIDFTGREVGDTIPLSLYLDREIHEVYIRYLGKEVIKTNIGRHRCILFKPLLIEGTLFEGGEEMNVWVTDDQNKIPLRVESPILIGSVRAEIHETKGVKYQIGSKVEK